MESLQIEFFEELEVSASRCTAFYGPETAEVDLAGINAEGWRFPPTIGPKNIKNLCYFEAEN